MLISQMAGRPRQQAAARYAAKRKPATLAVELANCKVPKRIVFADALPLNAMGKAQKTELRARYAGVFTEPRPA